MQITLVADCGSTKCHWAIINSEENKIIETKGFNPNTQEFSNLTQIVLELNLEVEKIKKIFFFGAGCGSPDNNTQVYLLLSNIYKNAVIEIQNDIYASALACLGKNNGIACILGTGSNVCKWKNQMVQEWEYNFGLGYILGDEGSGTHLGKCLLKSYFSNELSQNINSKLKEHLGTYSDIIQNIYKNKNPNIYLSKLSKFIAKNKEDESVRNVILKNFNDFVESNLLKIKEIKSLPIGITGSVAYYFNNELEEVMLKNELNLLKIIKNPIEGLIDFYKY